MTTRKPFFSDDDVRNLFVNAHKEGTDEYNFSTHLKHQVMATFALADRVSEVNDTFNRIAGALESLVAKGANDHGETMDVLNALKENTSSVIKKAPHFQQKN